MDTSALIPFPAAECRPSPCWRADADPLTAMKILIVDDDANNVALLEAMLGDAGFTCAMSVLDSRCAIESCKTFAPDLLLLDLMMPHIDGFAIMEALRASNGELLFPIIVLTADVDPKTKLRVLQRGVTDFLTKPLDYPEVLARITNALESRRRYQLLEKERAALMMARASTSELRTALWDLENKRNSSMIF